MSEQHPNPYYEELAHLVIAKPSVALKEGEVCFYEGKAQSYKTVTKIKKKPRKKTSFIITPWFALWGRKTYVETEKEDKNHYYSGRLYITNMRIIFNSSVGAFDLYIPSIASIKRYKNGIKVISDASSYDGLTDDLPQVLYVIDLINKAQE